MVVPQWQGVVSHETGRKNANVQPERSTLLSKIILRSKHRSLLSSFVLRITDHKGVTHLLSAPFRQPPTRRNQLLKDGIKRQSYRAPTETGRAERETEFLSRVKDL